MDTSSASSPPTRPQRRSRSFVFPLLLVVIGIVLLLNNLGVLPWSVWMALGQLWPAILILLGIDLLVGRRATWFGASLAVVAFLAVLGIAIWMTFTGYNFNPPSAATTTKEASIPLGAATSGQVTIQFGAGELTVGALPASATDLAQVTASLPGNMQLTQRSTVSGNVVDATIGTSGSGNFFPFRGFDRGGNVTMNANVAPQVPLVLRAEVGAGQAEFNLTDLAVHEFSLNNGAGQATIRFPKSAGQTTADIHSGAGQITLEVPPSVGAYIHVSNGLVNLSASDRFQKVGDGYQTSDYSSAPNRLDATLHVGIGEVDVR